MLNNSEIDRKIINGQKKFHLYFDRHFTFNKSLGFAIMVGAICAFIGSDCYGGIDIYSPLSVLVMTSLFFSLIQVVLFIKMPVIRIIKFMTVLASSYLLVKESYALYTTNFIKHSQSCAPYLYADDAIGYLWIIMPMIAIIGWCFAGNQEDKLKRYLESEESQSPAGMFFNIKRLFAKLGVLLNPSKTKEA